jgi:hypothetical protein
LADRPGCVLQCAARVGDDLAGIPEGLAGRFELRDLGRDGCRQRAKTGLDGLQPVGQIGNGGIRRGCQA